MSIEKVYRDRLEEEGLSRWWDFLKRKGQVYEYRDSTQNLHTVCRICGTEASPAQMGSHFRQVEKEWRRHQRWVYRYQLACESVLAKVLSLHYLDLNDWIWCGEPIAFVAKTRSIPRRLLRKVEP